MGFKEQLITDWKYKKMEYQGKKMWIADQFEYNNVEYLYAVDVSTFDDEHEEFDVAFLYKEKDDVFAYVKDEKLFNELLGAATGRLASQVIIEETKKMLNDTNVNI